MQDICRQDCDSEAVGGRSRGFSAQFRPLITQALIHTSSHWTELQKGLQGCIFLLNDTIDMFRGCISSQNDMVTGVHIFPKYQISDYPSSDTQSSQWTELQKVYRGVYLCSMIQLYA